MAKRIVAGNWKLFKTPDEASRFFIEFLQIVENQKNENLKKNISNIIIFPSAFALEAVKAATQNSGIGFGPQNMATEKEGAFTGELSAAHAKLMGANYVLIGHSERRKIFHETNQDIAKKISLATELGLTPILCVGESLQEREAEKTNSVILDQLKAGLANWQKSENIIVAYEPVWAIGTGKVATPEQAEVAHAVLRKELGDKISILYGGSVKPDNAAELIAKPNVDGFLVGGASLKAKDFAAICAAVF